MEPCFIDIHKEESLARTRKQYHYLQRKLTRHASLPRAQQCGAVKFMNRLGDLLRLREQLGIQSGTNNFRLHTDLLSNMRHICANSCDPETKEIAYHSMLHLSEFFVSETI